MAQDGPQLDPCSPKVFPMYHQDAINLPQDVHPTTHNIQHTPHSPGPAECAVAIESAAPRMGVQGVLDFTDGFAGVAEAQHAHQQDAEDR